MSAAFVKPVFKEGVEKVFIRLLGEDGKTLHGEGYVEYSRIEEAHVIERNRHTYHYSKIDGGVPIFIECNTPLLITEF